MTQVIIGTQSYDAAVSGKTRDPDWDYRSSKSITLAMDHDTAASLFQDGAAWSIRFQAPAYEDPETGETVTPEAITYDNSDYCVAGDITDHRDGTVTVKMGRLTALEETLELIYGGDTL